MTDSTKKSKKTTHPFAPKASVPEDAPDRKVLAAQLKELEVPEASAVGVPAYPEAVLIRRVSGVRMEVHGTKVETLPILQLLTPDGPDAVISFYDKKLKGWKKSSRGLATEFRPDTEPLREGDVNVSRPYVKVQPTRAEVLLPDARTRIEIAYHPPEP